MEKQDYDKLGLPILQIEARLINWINHKNKDKFPNAKNSILKLSIEMEAKDV